MQAPAVLGLGVKQAVLTKFTLLHQYSPVPRARNSIAGKDASRA